MMYISTRGDSEPLQSFEDVLFAGISSDGGLYIPEKMPKILPEEFESWSELKFPDITARILRKFIPTAELGEEDLDVIIKKAFSNFKTPDVTPLVELEKLDGSAGPRFILELFHGPTMAFKDIALQVLGLMFEHFLQKRASVNGSSNQSPRDLVIIGATSGDTGGAAISSLKGKKNIHTFIIYPNQMISKVQKLQMTTVLDDNVHTIALSCNFDTCQDVAKRLLKSDLNQKVNLSSINSINLVRIICQISYYCYATIEVRRRLKKSDLSSNLRFIVPSGNLGDALAGIYAKMMGLPIKSIVMATNSNSSLKALMDGGSFSISAAKIVPTHSTAMDIMVGSNLERVLWHAFYDVASKGEAEYVFDDKASRRFASECVRTLYTIYMQTSMIMIENKALENIKKTVSVVQVTDDEVLEVINKYYYSTLKERMKNNKSPLIVDPHTAVGIKASDILSSTSCIDICISTASPAKFSQSVIKAMHIKTPYVPEDIECKDFSEHDFITQEILSLDGYKQKPSMTFSDAEEKNTDLIVELVKKAIISSVVSS